MNSVHLAKKTKRVLRELQSQYKKRIRKGQLSSDAADFGSSIVIHEQFFADWTLLEVDAACAELLRTGLLDGFRADGYVYSASLSDEGIAFRGENFSEDVPKFVGWVLELAQAIRSLLLG